MKISNLVLALATLTMSSSAFAGILTLEDSGSKVNGITISKGGALKVESRGEVKMITVAAGQRSKLGGLVKVYVGELLVADKAKFACRGNALESLKDQAAVAVRMNMQYSITADDMEAAFQGGFENNNIAETPAIKAFVAAVKNGGKPTSGTKISFSGEKIGDKEIVTYENSAGVAKSIEGGAGFIKAVFSLWLGNPGSDNGLKNVRDNFVNCEVK